LVKEQLELEIQKLKPKAELIPGFEDQVLDLVRVPLFLTLS
jgi:hypothetical protein